MQHKLTEAEQLLLLNALLKLQRLPASGPRRRYRLLPSTQDTPSTQPPTDLPASSTEPTKP